MCPQIVIYSGIGLSVVPAITLLFFDDDKFLKEEEDEAAPLKDDNVTSVSSACPLSLVRCKRGDELS